MIGRKLNTRLAELKMQSKETMSKQQLQTLFEHERDKELERLGEISEAAKIFGRAGDVVDMELDLEAGWAYQLLAKFGTRVELSLEEGCIGLSYLSAPQPLAQVLKPALGGQGDVRYGAGRAHSDVGMANGESGHRRDGC